MATYMIGNGRVSVNVRVVVKAGAGLVCWEGCGYCSDYSQRYRYRHYHWWLYGCGYGSDYD